MMGLALETSVLLKLSFGVSVLRGFTVILIFQDNSAVWYIVFFVRIISRAAQSIVHITTRKFCMHCKSLV